MTKRKVLCRSSSLKPCSLTSPKPLSVSRLSALNAKLKAIPIYRSPPSSMAVINRLHAAVSVLRPHRSFVGSLKTRAYGSAAAVEYDYYYYDEDVDQFQLSRDRNRNPVSMVDSEGWTPERGVQWVMIGEPGARRHAYAKRLSKILEVPYISMASLVRQELSPCSPLYKQIANALNERKPVPEEIIFGLLTKRLEEGYSRGDTGFILAGIPRTRIQAEILDQIVHVDLVVNFKCTEGMSGTKNLGMANGSQEYLTIHSSRSSLHRHLQDEKVGMSIAEQNKIVEEYYRKQKKLLNVAPGETWQGLLAALHLQHVNAISSSQKLTV